MNDNLLKNKLLFTRNNNVNNINNVPKNKEFITTNKLNFNKKTLDNYNIVTEEQKNKLRMHNFDFKYENNPMITSNNIYFNKKEYHKNDDFKANNRKNNLNLIQKGKYPKYSAYKYNYKKFEKENDLKEIEKIKKNIENIRASNIILGKDYNQSKLSIMKGDYSNNLDYKLPNIEFNNKIKMNKGNINLGNSSNNSQNYKTIFMTNFNEKKIENSKELENWKNDLRNHHFEWGYDNNDYVTESKLVGNNKNINNINNGFEFEEEDEIKGDQQIKKKNNKTNFILGEKNKEFIKSSNYKENFTKHKEENICNKDFDKYKVNNLIYNDYKNSYDTENKLFYKKYDSNDYNNNRFNYKKDNFYLGSDNSKKNSEMKYNYIKFNNFEKKIDLKEKREQMKKSNFEIAENTNFDELSEYKKNYLKLNSNYKNYSLNKNYYTKNQEKGEYNTIYRDNFYLKDK